jgi:hypothetical protein
MEETMPVGLTRILLVKNEENPHSQFSCNPGDMTTSKS